MTKYTREQISDLYMSLIDERNKIRDRWVDVISFPISHEISMELTGADKVLEVFDKWIKEQK